jgi:hypothetical protein
LAYASGGDTLRIVGQHRALACVVACVAAACGSTSAATSSAPPATERVSDSIAQHLLLRAFHAARLLGRRDHLCGGCYPSVAGDITEDMNGITDEPYAIAFTPMGAHMTGVVYLDTVGAGKLSRTHITLYARTSNGTIWMLAAGRGRPHLGIAE